MTGSMPASTDERRPAVTNDRRLDRIAWLAVAAAWLLAAGLLSILIWSEEGAGRASLLALAIITTSAATAHSVVWLHDRMSGHWRWPVMAATVLLGATVGHAVLMHLGMDQSWAQDLLNLVVISGIALAIRLAWGGYRTRLILEAEVRRRELAEAQLTMSRLAADRPHGPVAVKVGHGQVLLDPTTIICLEAEANFARIVSDTGEVFASEPLKTLAERLAPYGFVRVHKSFVVNRSRVRRRGAEGLSMDDGARVPVGRAYRAALD